MHAADADSEQPIYIQADDWTYDDLKQVSVLSGRVIVTQGTRIIKGDRVVMREDPQGYRYISSTSGRSTRATFRKKRDGVDEYIEGEGNQIDYNGKSEVTTLTRRATVRRVQGSGKVIDEVQGSVIRYDARKDFYTAHAGQDAAGPAHPTGRVRAMLSPRNSMANADASAGGAAVTLGTSSRLRRTVKP